MQVSIIPQVPTDRQYRLLFLASPRASFITGVNLAVDGALTNRVQY